MIRIVTLSAIAVAIAASGCGSDDSGAEVGPTVSIPAVTSPLGTTSTVGSATTTRAQPTATSKGGRTYDPNQPDSETNDVPPPPRSPQETFEKQCDQNPQACG